MAKEGCHPTMQDRKSYIKSTSPEGVRALLANDEKKLTDLLCRLVKGSELHNAAGPGTNSQTRLVTKAQLRDALGFKSVRTIENLMRRRAIPYVRLGHRSVFFEIDKVRAALAKFERKAVGQ